MPQVPVQNIKIECFGGEVNSTKNNYFRHILSKQNPYKCISK